MADRTPTDQDRTRAAYWLGFLISNSEFPDSDLLSRHFAGAEITGYCECGCNSFSIKPLPSTGMLVRPGRRGGVISKIEFRELGTKNPLTILVFADEEGRACFVEVDYCGNAFPVPSDIQLDPAIYHKDVYRDLVLS